MTMSSSQREVEYLANEIIQNERPVTYHKFSRALSIPINQAKLILYEYYQKNADKLTASFLITGITPSGDRLIKLSEDESTLENDMQKFETILTIHIYCINSKVLKFTYSDIALEEKRFASDHTKIKEYERNGMIAGPPITIKDVKVTKNIPSSPVAPAPVAKRRTTETKLAATATTTKPATTSSSYVSRKQQQQEEQPAARTKTLMSNYTSRKSEPEKTSPPRKRAATEPAKQQFEYKSRKKTANEPRERVIFADHDDADNVNDKDEDHEPESGSRQTKINTSALEKLFESDFSDDDNDNDVAMETPEPEKEKEQPILISEDSEPEPHKETSPIVADIEPESIPIEEEDQSQVEEEEQETMEKKIDDDGYITTVRKGRPATKPNAAGGANKRQRATTPTSGGVGKGGSSHGKKKAQASLMSFFQKK
ncbi:uncharacterized protein J8A68_005420 [[Candida] subhashii]|uniref:DNA polymerase delta subunit 3 n=1 Tax=[Candida] subhashii TaxID=561895 RepID=A0A8J5QEW3_9ASCO|nr:uncharacterized protein J8A68_005420 [[Candida] subhashii]KAG7661048.1 hypothetical protein J8A68_005420 [[Candida] subhashii]